MGIRTHSPTTLFADSRVCSNRVGKTNKKITPVDFGGQRELGWGLWKDSSKGAFPQESRILEYMEILWVAGKLREKKRHWRHWPRLLCNVLQGHSYLRVSLSSGSSVHSCRPFSANAHDSLRLCRLRGEHWMWSQKAGILRAALSPAGSEICCLCFNLLFNESTGPLINNQGKILENVWLHLKY